MIRECSLPETRSFDGVMIRYEKKGESGPSIVLIHGWCCNGTYWRKTTPSLAKDHRVYTINLAGHGGSGSNRRDWTIENYGRDVEALADEENLNGVTLVGHSMGGDVALAAAHLLGERVRGVVLVDSYNNIAIRSERQIQEIVAPLRENFRENSKQFIRGMFTKNSDPDFVEEIAADMSSRDAYMAIMSIESTLHYSDGDAFDRINVPVRCINCDMSPADYESARRHLRDFDETTMKGIGHFMMLERPDEFNEILRDTIASL
jgi:pimeloyl-ACP methyl ester carboxylesterase